MERRLEQVEERIAWLEQANAELGEVVLEQRREILALRARLDSLADRLAAAQAVPTAYSAEDEKPPHY